MSDKSSIEWTDATWNPTTGCTKVSPGCAHCYIETTTPFRMAGRKFINGATDLRLHEGRLEQPLRWKKPKRIFVNSLSDLFHEGVSDAFIDRVFATMQQTQHTYQLLTKRHVRMREYSTALAQLDPHARGRRILTSMYADHPARRAVLDNLEDKDVGAFPWPLPNVLFGHSVENQRAATRLDYLLSTPAAGRFVSVEPLLEHVEISPWLARPLGQTRVDWVIVGGESGPSARPFDLAWARALVEQCRAAGVPVFVKQLGSSWFDAASRRGVRGSLVVPALNAPWTWVKPGGKGGDMAEWPEDLQIREFPTVGATT